jgi:hypothetical protein
MRNELQHARVQLLQCRVNGILREQMVQRYYNGFDRAITTTTSSDSLLDALLCHELTAEFHLRRDMPKDTNHHFDEAISGSKRQLNIYKSSVRFVFVLDIWIQTEGQQNKCGSATRQKEHRQKRTF